MKVQQIEANINEGLQVVVKYGPLVLAIDSMYGTQIMSTSLKAEENSELLDVSIPVCPETIGRTPYTNDLYATACRVVRVEALSRTR